MKKMLIDTSNLDFIEVGLEIDGKRINIKKKIKRGSQLTLNLIDQLLKKQRIGINEIEKIEIKTGPGSFTGLRVGIAIANTFSFFKEIPLNDKRKKIMVEPKYS